MGRKGRDPDELRALLADAAEALIVEQGMGGCTARAVTGRAGCALGALGYLFGGLENVILVVNERTLQDMRRYMFGQVEICPQADARERLTILALAYFSYARDHQNRWNALFLFRFASQGELPDAYLALWNGLIARIGALYSAELNIPEDQWSVLARTMYEAVHGIVVLGLDRKPGGSGKDVEARIRLLVARLVQPPVG